jgi:hypothetical protein
MPGDSSTARSLVKKPSHYIAMPHIKEQIYFFSSHENRKYFTIFLSCFSGDEMKVSLLVSPFVLMNQKWLA